LKFGIPQVILTDQCSNFQLTCKCVQIVKNKNQSISSSNCGSLERTRRVLVEYLRCYILEDQTDWDKWIPYATFVFNAMPHYSTGFTSLELLFVRKHNIPGVLQKDSPEIKYSYNSYVQELQS